MNALCCMVFTLAFSSDPPTPSPDIGIRRICEISVSGKLFFWKSMCPTGTLPSWLSPSSSFSEIPAENRQVQGWGGNDEQKGMVGSRGTKLRRLVQVQVVMYWENLGKSFHLLSPHSSSVTWAHGVLMMIKWGVHFMCSVNCLVYGSAKEWGDVIETQIATAAGGSRSCCTELSVDRLDEARRGHSHHRAESSPGGRSGSTGLPGGGMVVCEVWGLHLVFGGQVLILNRERLVPYSLSPVWY